jgi:hypothetical protein
MWDVGIFSGERHSLVQKMVSKHPNLAAFKSLLTVLELAEANLHDEDGRA